MLASAREECASLTSRLAHAQAAKDAAAASEAFLARSLKDATAERDRAQRAADSIKSIESALSASAAAAAARASEERLLLSNTLASLRSSAEAEAALAAATLAKREGELRAAAARCGEAERAAGGAREEAAAAAGEAVALRAQVATLNEHLTLLRGRVESRVSALGGRGEMEAGRLAAAESRMIELATELEQAKQALEGKERALSGALGTRVVFALACSPGAQKAFFGGRTGALLSLSPTL